MEAVADLPRDDDTPPPSGVRPRVCAPDTGAPPPSPRPRGGGSAPETPSVLPEVAEEVFFEVWDLVRALSPLQGSWFGARPLGVAALTVALWRGPRRRLLRERWPELVPGYAAMDRLAEVMVDALC